MFTRIKQRTDTYANWEAQNNNTPGGLKILEGEICVIIADAASAAAKLSNPVAILNIPLKERLANTGEVLGTKVGNGFAVRWDEIPTNFHIPNVNFANGSGRVLGTRQNGASHVYAHPGEMFKAIFGPVYSAPGVGVQVLDTNNSDLNGALLEVGQAVAGVHVTTTPQVQTYRVKLGKSFESTSGRVQLGADETAVDPNSISAFSRSVPGFIITPGNSTYNPGAGIYGRSFTAQVTDDRPGAEGGNVEVNSGTVAAFATYPTFFGKTAAALPADEAGRGAFLQANCSALIRSKARYDAGKLPYRNGQKPVFAYPEAWGPLAQILDELGLNQLGYAGAAFDAPVRALVSKGGQYQNVPYLVYTANGNGFNSDILFSFLF